MRYQGKISHWNDNKGYGFVVPNGGGDRAFVHVKAFVKPARRPIDGDVIAYSVVKEPDGRLRAANISLAHVDKTSGRLKPMNSKRGFAFTVGFFVFLVSATAIGKLPIQVLVIYVLASLITFVAYAVDKSAAKRNRWRTKESTLHLFGLIGGWPGALLAQSLLRHKSKKTEFKLTFWVTVVVNVVAILYLLSEPGAAYLAVISDLW